MDPQSITKTLQSIQFLHDLPQNYLDRIANISRVREYNGGDIVFHEGDDARTLYLIVSGTVSLKIGAGGMGSKQIVKLGPGELMGWSSLSNHPHFAATAVVEGGAAMIEIDGARVRSFCDNDPQFGYEIMSRVLLTLGKRLIDTWSQLADVYVPHYASLAIGAAARNE